MQLIWNEQIEKWEWRPESPAERDPKVWPVAGDVLLADKISHKLTRKAVGVYCFPEYKRYGGWQILFYESRRWRGGMRECSLKAWRKWAKRAVVLERGDDETSYPQP